MEGIAWHGRFDEVTFLQRVWDLNSMPSNDYRHANAAEDIARHRIGNYDWPDDWLFGDARFDLTHGPDETFLRFVAETVHPALRRDPDETRQLVEFYNRRLGADGWALYVAEHKSGRPVYRPRRRKGSKAPATAIRIPEYQRLKDPEVFEDHLRRIEAGLIEDPAAAIASSKELVESACKVVLDDYGISYKRTESLLDLYKKTALVLKLNAEAVPGNRKGSAAAQGALRSLSTAVQRLAELRNEIGLGHGGPTAIKSATRHARLAFGAGSTVAEFLLDTWHERRDGD